MASAILTGRYIRSTFVEDQSEFVEHLQIGKQIGKLLDMPKHPPGPKTSFLDLEYEKFGNLVQDPWPPKYYIKHPHIPNTFVMVLPSIILTSPSLSWFF